MASYRTDQEVTRQIAEFWFYRRERRVARAKMKRGQRVPCMRSIHAKTVAFPMAIVQVKICTHGITIYASVEPLYFTYIERI